MKKSELARQLRVSRRTIIWLAAGQLDRDLDTEPCATPHDRWWPRSSTLTKGSLPQAFPRLTAQRLFDEIQAVGYVGGYTQVKAYMRQVRPQSPPEPVVRFETPPGFF